jgi:SAM-dependent methyltransferase
MPSDADGIVPLYQRHAQAYDRLRGRSLFEKPWLDAFAALLPAGGAVLDIGCGMGEPIARDLIERGLAVMGIDSSPDLIAMARSRFPQQIWMVADMRTLSLGRTFDGLIAWDSFFHLTPEDQRRMFCNLPRSCGARCGADVHQRAGAWRCDGGIRRRAAVSREPGPAGIPHAAR